MANNKSKESGGEQEVICAACDRAVDNDKYSVCQECYDIALVLPADW